MWESPKWTHRIGWNNMKLEDVEKIVFQLDPQDQRRLADGIYRQLNAKPAESTAQRQARRERMLAALAKCDEIAGTIDGEFDSAEDMRQLRERRL